MCGLDLDPARFQAVVRAEKLNVKEVDFEVAPLPFEDDAVDVVIFHEVFEHLRINPIFTFSEISRVLRTQGTLLLSTPNLTSWKGWYNFAVKGRLPVDVYDGLRAARHHRPHGARASLFAAGKSPRSWNGWALRFN